MKANWNDPVGRVRIIGHIEAISYFLLLGVAMPMKYFADMPWAVTYTGWAHGALFVALMLAIAAAFFGKHLGFKLSALAVIASLLPFGPYLVDRKLARSEAGELTADGKRSSLPPK